MLTGKPRQIKDNLPASLAPRVGPVKAAMAKLFGALLTFETPIVQFPGDIVIGASTSKTIDIQGLLSNRCCGFMILDVVGTVKVSVNGGGLRTIAVQTQIQGAWIRNLTIYTGAASSCLVQLNGF